MEWHQRENKHRVQCVFNILFCLYWNWKRCIYFFLFAAGAAEAFGAAAGAAFAAGAAGAAAFGWVVVSFLFAICLLWCDGDVVFVMLYCWERWRGCVHWCVCVYVTEWETQVVQTHGKRIVPWMLRCFKNEVDLVCGIVGTNEICSSRSITFILMFRKKSVPQKRHPFFMQNAVIGPNHRIKYRQKRLEQKKKKEQWHDSKQSSFHFSFSGAISTVRCISQRRRPCLRWVNDFHELSLIFRLIGKFGLI
jgi:hypothetical protein